MAVSEAENRESGALTGAPIVGPDSAADPSSTVWVWPYIFGAALGLGCFLLWLTVSKALAWAVWTW